MASSSLRRLRVLARAVSTSSRTPVVTVNPLIALIDEPVTISVSGLLQSQKVTLSAHLTNDGKEFLSCAHYTSDHDGKVDTTVQPSEGGSFTGVEPMGLFWSMVSSPRQRKGARLVKKDVNKPYDVSISVLSNHRDLSSVLTARDTSDILASTHIERWYMGKGVKRLPVKEGNIRGALFIPEGDGPFPAIIDMFGGSGGLFDFRGALLASHGYLTLSLAFLSYDDLPPYEELEFAYFKEAADWLSQHKKVTPGGIGVIGVSFGASLTYLLSAFSDKIRTAVTINGYPMSPLKDQIMEGEFVKGHILSFSIIDGYGISQYAGLDQDTKIIPFWRKGTPILRLMGDDDVSADVELNETLMKQVPSDQKHHLESISYPKAGHLIEPPYTPHHSETFIPLDPAFGYEGGFKFRWGGETKPHAQAQEDAWRRVLQHFDKHLRNRK